MQGASPELRSELGLKTPGSYQFTNQKLRSALARRGAKQADIDAATELDDTFWTVQGRDEVAEFEELLRAFAAINLEEDWQHQIWQILAALLNLGNVGFEDEKLAASSSKSKPILAERCTAALAQAARLMRVEEGALTSSLCETCLAEDGGSGNSTARTAGLTRDAVAKAIYGRLFDWLLKKMNSALEASAAVAASLRRLDMVAEYGETTFTPQIGILDIFGFEFFQRNGFEQLLINYTNEVLQGIFNKQLFENEVELYKQEGIILPGQAFKVWPTNKGSVAILGADGEVHQQLANAFFYLLFYTERAVAAQPGNDSAGAK